ncbi:MAG TPA: FecR domain-containing protein [Prolixibacteraceae bacterium]|nr:FecR domain-containing protein [Prolixibacteraceae bacterium]
MLKGEDIELIDRYISGTADKNEIASVENLFSNGKNDLGLKNHIEVDWDNVLHETIMDEVNLNNMLDRVHHLIREKEFQKRKSFVHRITHIYLRIAAILLLPLLLAGGLIFTKNSNLFYLGSTESVSSVIHAPLGSRVSFSLPDGSTGWLNSGSSLTYSIPFTNNRKVALEGEAWFDVAHNKKYPFEISAGQSTVKVLGTSFNMSAYSNQPYIEVVLQEGKVEFSVDSKKSKIIMSPSERLVLQNGVVAITTTDPAKYRSWTDGKLVFRGDAMAEVASRIERWYNVQVELADDELNQFSFRATFEDDSLEEVLKLLSMTSPIGYTIIPRKQNSDGTYQKGKVILFKKSNK